MDRVTVGKIQNLDGWKFYHLFPLHLNNQTDFFFISYTFIRGEIAPYKTSFSLSFLKSCKSGMFLNFLSRSRTSGCIILSK